MKMGIDLGGTKIAAALVDEDYRIVSKGCAPTGRDRTYDEIISDMAALADMLLKENNLTTADMEYIGVGCPGVLDRSRGYVLYSNNIHWDNVDLAGEFRKHLDCPIYIDNDANCAALGEYIAGAAQGYRSALIITLGTGVGSGLILDGKIYTGFNQAAGVFGHTVVVSGGEQCTCGRYGCLEAYASVTALLRMGYQAAQQHPESELGRIVGSGIELDGKNIFECAHHADPAAEALVAQFLFYVAEGVTNFINMLQPEVVVIGGGLSKEGEYLLAPVRERVSQDVFCKCATQPDIRIARLGNDAGIIGAAFLKQYQ